MAFVGMMVLSSIQLRHHCYTLSSPSCSQERSFSADLERSETAALSSSATAHRAGGLTLVTAAIAHWNTVYIDKSVQALASNGTDIDPKLLKYLSPLGWEHINLTGDLPMEGQETRSREIQAPSD
jgi:hypothetical protein